LQELEEVQNSIQKVIGILLLNPHSAIKVLKNRIVLIMRDVPMDESFQWFTETIDYKSYIDSAFCLIRNLGSNDLQAFLLQLFHHFFFADEAHVAPRQFVVFIDM
jgi:hypothetical protein